MVIFLFTWVTVSIIQLILLYYIKYVVQREAQSDLIMATIFVVALLALPLWQWVSRRLNKRLAYIAGIAFLMGVLLCLASLSPATSLALLLVLCMLAGIGVAAHVLPGLSSGFSLMWRMAGEHEGMFWPDHTGTKIAVSLALLLALVLNYAVASPMACPAQRWRASIAQPVPAIPGTGHFVHGALSIKKTEAVPQSRGAPCLS
jgi:GPH family glycoside/pentoside/hexuronide:cation symporter